MKAVILAGGEGTRLRPLTCTMPKPLVPLCGKPVLYHIIDLLADNGIKKAALTLRFKAEQIEAAFDGGSRNGVEVEFFREEKPLGTAGCVRSAVGSGCGDILIISGDAMCDFNLREDYEKFCRSGADAAIIVKKVSDPREYGLVLTDKGGFVKSFLEKPSYESCISELANTGIYFLKESAVNGIAKGTESDFAKDIFPKMLIEGKKILAIEEQGYWCDIGTAESYLRCCRDIIEGRVRCEISGHKTLDGIVTSSSDEYRGAKITAPVFIGRNVRIAKGAVIEGGSVLSDGVTVCGGAKVHSAVLMAGDFIGAGATVNAAVICENARVLSGAAVYEGAAVGAASTVGENAVIESGVRIWAGKSIESGTVISYDIKYGSARYLSIDDEGICGETNAEITPRDAVLAGQALGAVENGICVIHGDSRSARALAAALCAGAASAGSNVWSCGCGFEAQLDYAMKASKTNLGCCIESGAVTKITVFARGGLPITRKQERIIEAALRHSEYPRAAFDEFGSILSAPSLTELYRQDITLRAKKIPRLCFNVQAVSASGEIARIASECLKKATADKKDAPNVIFHISADGRRLSAHSDTNGYYLYEKLLLLGCTDEFEHRRNVALPFSSPSAIDAAAEKYGTRVIRYYSCSADNSDENARRLSESCSFAHDGIILMLKILTMLGKSGKTLDEAMDTLPKFGLSSRFVPTEKAPAALLKDYCVENAGLGEGVVADTAQGRVLIRPAKSGRGVTLFAEAFMQEQAAELCGYYEQELRKK